MPTETITGSPSATMCALMEASAQKEWLKKVVFSKARDSAVTRRTLSLCRVRGETVWQLETLRRARVADVAGKGKPVEAFHENFPLSDASERLAALTAEHDQINLLTTVGDVSLMRSKNGRETLLGAAPLQKALAGDQTLPRVVIGGHDRKKARILTGDEPFLKLLGVADADGRVHDKKQAKYRQINRFLELIRDVESALPTEGTLHIYDLCCGKSYLSFAVYHYFTVVRGRDVQMVGVDMKADVIADCQAIADALHMDGLSFVCGDVSRYTLDTPVHLVISLHACDTATDLVLDKAIAGGADVVLSTPCCHHEWNRKIAAPALAFLTEHSMLRQKLCDAATDALRLKRLEAAGYEVAALELIDPEETPKNVMLRGIKKYPPTAARCRRAAEAYDAARAFLLGEETGVRHAQKDPGSLDQE